MAGREIARYVNCHLHKILPTVFQSGCTNLYFLPQSKKSQKFRSSPTLGITNLVWSDFFLSPIKWGQNDISSWHWFAFPWSPMWLNTISHVFPLHMFPLLWKACPCLYIFYFAYLSFSSNKRNLDWKVKDTFRKRGQLLRSNKEISISKNK